ncbi:uncharacterized protein C8A04DRAFT_15528 [Dichotomopilus funicola]|uniref:F-box domain-containing protein n=1 Tax=Dichotomopilus funicola TaxID=1934379 RepID=A0AAN6UV63_9PEZI|nr:hypothetical protein C8A04DRAFT_15528 [Dichotomopilus funicola]
MRSQGPPSCEPGFLQLPRRARYRIYRHVQVTKSKWRLPFVYDFNLWRSHAKFPDRWNRRIPHPAREFGGLLRSCRAIYTEVTTLFYSTHRFVIHYSQPGSFRPLLALSPAIISSLTKLDIVLNQSSCHQFVNSECYPPECCYEVGLGGGVRLSQGVLGKNVYICQLYPKHHPHQPSLLGASSDDYADTLLKEWEEVAAHLAPHITHNNLCLSVVCDLDPAHENALKVAKQIAAPLAVFPQLKDCHIRFSKLWDRQLQSLACDTVHKARAHTLPLSSAQSTKRTGLACLPPELRIRILEYTDLIPPWKEVSWSRQDQKYLLNHPICDLDGRRDLSPNGACPPDVHHGCLLHQCHGGAAMFQPDYDTHPGCFCRRRHGAFSSRCRCWTPPTYLFLICRDLCRDAQYVFFSRNRFIVHDFHATPPDEIPPVQHEPPPADNSSSLQKYYPFDRLAAAEFLDVVPDHCLGHLRFLELVFPPYAPHGWPRTNHPALTDWALTTKKLRHALEASRNSLQQSPVLKIRFIVAGV